MNDELYMSQYNFSYSYDSLNDAFNIANRKGKMQKKYLSEDYLNAAQEYRNMKKELNEILKKKKTERTEADAEEIDILRQKLIESARRQKELLKSHLDMISAKILSSTFRFNLTPQESEDYEKPNYVIGETPEEYFAMQVLCRNFKQLFKIQMSGREEILSQLKTLLNEDKCRKYLIRTDVSSCFETIPHDKLFDLLERNSLLDVKSKSLLRGLIMKEYEQKNLRRKIATPHVGIPRGCAISSLLAEFYLSKVDNELRRTLPGVVFMARYVDDLIMVIHPDIDEARQWSKEQYVNKLAGMYAEKGLTIHTPDDGSNKCYTYDSAGSSNLKFELLGYNILSENGNANKQGFFSLSKNKGKKIKDRISKTFAKFNDLLDNATYDIAAHYLFDALHVLSINLQY